MCGVFFTSQNKPTDISVSKALLSIMHRGPDDMGEFYSELNDCKMGHVRLSILDISSQGKQPMVDSSGRYVISFNGEIYNYIELRRELPSCGVKQNPVISFPFLTFNEGIETTA